VVRLLKDLFREVQDHLFAIGVRMQKPVKIHLGIDSQ
jgi:hypothetical protein